MLTYHLPVGVEPLTIDGRPVLTTPEGGKVALDPALLGLWQAAPGHSLDEVLQQCRSTQMPTGLVRAGLAALAEAGLLLREAAPAPVTAPAPASPAPAPSELVSAIIIGYNCRRWMEDLVPSLLAQTHTALEIIMVDDASTDGLDEWLRREYPQVRRLRQERHHSLAANVNAAARLAAGQYLLILNADIRLAPEAVAELVAAARRQPQCGAVAAKLKFTWAPAFLNGLGNYVPDRSWGSDLGLGHLDLGQFDDWRTTPSACFAAALIPRGAWQAVGPVDESFPLYYEDTEWSYRARLLGYEVAAAPAAVIYHAFGSDVPSGVETPLSPTKTQRAAYGRLRFSLKLAGRPLLGKLLRQYLSEDASNFGQALRRGDWPHAAAYLRAWSNVLLELPGLLRQRRGLQAARRRNDSELFYSIPDLPAPLDWHGLPELTLATVRRVYLPLFQSRRTRRMPEFHDAPRRPHLLIVSNDVVDIKMAGPGVRYLELARALAEAMDVTLAVPTATRWAEPGLGLVQYDEARPESLQTLVENSDVALVSGYMVRKFPFLQYTRTRLVVDLYDPFFLENLHYYVREPMATQLGAAQDAASIANRLAQLGDFFICGNERQRDLYMGVLAANQRINPLTFQQDGSLRKLIDVVGTGIPSRPPRPGTLLRGVHPAVPAEAQIVLWGGGIWDWLDPLTLVRAWPATLARHPQARLVFLGTRHPNATVPVHQMAHDTQALAESIGEKDKSILFFEWLPYHDFETLLGEADVGVSLHPVHLETRYSIRTRVLDYFWARLPVVATEGDVTSDWVRELGLGQVVPPFDEQAVAAALEAVLSRPKASWAPAFEVLPQKFGWSQVVQPLRRYCLEGEYAADRQAHRGEFVPEPQRGSLAQAVFLWRTEGFPTMVGRGWRYLQMRLAGF